MLQVRAERKRALEFVVREQVVFDDEPLQSTAGDMQKRRWARVNAINDDGEVPEAKVIKCGFGPQAGIRDVVLAQNMELLKLGARKAVEEGVLEVVTGPLDLLWIHDRQRSELRKDDTVIIEGRWGTPNETGMDGHGEGLEVRCVS